LLITIGLGALFMYCQYVEYTSASFTFSDTVYGSAFYLTTGFHGFHGAPLNYYLMIGPFRVLRILMGVKAFRAYCVGKPPVWSLYKKPLQNPGAVRG
jgi:heme/copper-type cytochrome/quinol oxidase subunit 3